MKAGNAGKAITMLVAAMALAAGAPTSRADWIEAWGYNYDGQLGDGTTTDRHTPVTVNGLSGVSLIASGDRHSFALAGGKLWAWGGNGAGQLGIMPWYPNRSTPGAVNGMNGGITAIAGGTDYTLALMDGGIWAWGANSSGELGDGTKNTHQTPVAISALASGVSAIACGSSQSLALKGGGAWSWGWNGYGQLGDGTTTSHSTPTPVSGLSSGVTVIAGGALYSLAVKDGTVWSWGDNRHGQLGDGTTVTRSTPAPITGISGSITALSAGDHHSLALKNGGVWTWGDNANGQLGDGTTTDRWTPAQVDPADLTSIVAVAAGSSASYALSADGSLWVWGGNYDGQLGLGDTADRLTPTHLLPPSGYVFTSVRAAPLSDHVLATVAPAPEPTSLAALLSAGPMVLLRRRH